MRRWLIVWALAGGLGVGVRLVAAAGAGPAGVPKGATILKHCDFETGTDGWRGEHATTGPIRGRGGLRGPRMPRWSTTGVAVDFSAGLGTTLSLWYYADGPGWLGVRLVPHGQKPGGRTYRAGCIDPLVQRCWVHVSVPIVGRFAPFGKGKTHEPVKPGEKFSGVRIEYEPWKPAAGPGGKDASFIVFDDFVLYNVGESARLNGLVGELAAAEARLEKVPPAAAGAAGRLAAAAAKARADCVALARDHSGYQISSEVQALAERADTLLRRIRRLEKYLATASPVPAKLPAATFGVVSPMVRVTDRNPTYRFDGDLATEARIDLARGEAESVQLVLLPLVQDLQAVRVEWTDLKPAAGGRAMPKSVLTVRWPECVFMPTTGNHRMWSVRNLGWTPDPLMPSAPAKIRAEEQRPILLTVEAPRDAAAGEYAATVTVRAKDAEAVSIKLAVRVRDFDVPLRGRMRNQTNLNLSGLQKFYGKAVTAEQRRAWQVLALKHRIQPTAQYSRELSPPPEDVPHLLPHGLNMMMIGGGSSTRPLAEDRIRKQFDDIKRLKVVDMSVIYLADEVSGAKHIAWINKKANWIHRHCPGMRTMTGGVALHDGLIGQLDIWDLHSGPYRNGYSPANIPKLAPARARGEELFWYICCVPAPPYPNVMLCNSLYESRVWYWLTWRFGFSGSEYWNFISFKNNIKPPGQKRWPEVPWDTMAYNPGAEGNLAYPGPDGLPIASLRLENMRDGAEDWECFSILEDLRDLVSARPELKAKATGLLKRAERVLALTDLIHRPDRFCRDPARYVARRTELLDVIEGLIRLAGQGRYQLFAARRDQELLQKRRDALAKKIKAAGGTPPDYKDAFLTLELQRRIRRAEQALPAR